MDKQPAQKMKVFFNFDNSPNRKHLPARPTDDFIHQWLKSTDCPLNDVVVRKGSLLEGGNEDNFGTLYNFAFTALKRHNHSCRGMNFGIYASSGQGKTFVVERWARTIGIPFIFVQSKSLDNTYTLFTEMQKAFKAFGTPLVEIEPDKYRVPPCIVFFDEAHALATGLVESALLNPMDSGDSTMYCQAKKAAPILVVDVAEVCWVAATTDKADLFDAFRSRLREIEWQSAGKEELPLMIKSAMDKEYKNGNLPFPIPSMACEMIYRYAEVPRKANDFARDMILHKGVYTCTWAEAAEAVRKARGYDEHGMHFRQLAILKALGGSPLAKKNLFVAARCRQEEVEADHLPALMCYREDRPWAMSTGRGMAITRSGLKQLELRGLPHKGDRITAEAIMERAVA